MLRSNDPEHQGVFDFVMALAAAVKNYTLYPPGHSIAQKHLLQTSRLLTPFLEKHNNLRIDVDKVTLRYGDDLVYQGTAEENDIAYLLGRDGIQYLEFLKGIEQWELQSLLTVINNHRIQDEMADGDIATALWEQEYPHIRYKAVDILSLDAPALNFSGFRVRPQVENATEDPTSGTGSGQAQHAAEPGSSTSPAVDHEYQEQEKSLLPDADNAPPVSIALTAKGNDLWALSLTERYQLEQMVAEAEKKDDTDDVIDLLLITLVLLNDKHNFTQTLDFLQDRLIRTMKSHNFRSALKVLKNLKNIQDTCTVKKRWALPLLNDFFTALAQPESQREIERFLLNPPAESAQEQMEYLQSLLCILPASILTTIAPLTAKVPADSKILLFKIIKHHAHQNPQALANVILILDEELCFKLMPIAEWMKTDDGTKVFTQMALHPARNVSRKAFEILVRRDTLEPVDLFPLIDDPEEDIRKKTFAILGKKRNRQAEKRLLLYLERGAGNRDDKDHVGFCYIALGRCGGKNSVPFLKKILLEKAWGNLLSLDALAHRQGAAQALASLRLEEAEAVLKEGAKSMRPDIRSICRKVMGK